MQFSALTMVETKLEALHNGVESFLNENFQSSLFVTLVYERTENRTRNLIQTGPMICFGETKLYKNASKVSRGGDARLGCDDKRV